MAVIFLVIATLIIILFTAPLRYRANFSLENKKLKGNFKAGFLLNGIAVKGKIIGSNIEMNLNILFFKKKLNMKSKKFKGYKDNKKKTDIMDTICSVKQNRKYIEKILDKLKPDYLSINGCYGFEDPSWTGMFTGFLYTLEPIFNKYHIDLNPSFFDNKVYIKLGICGKIRLISIVNCGGVSWILKKIRMNSSRNLKISLRRKPS